MEESPVQRTLDEELKKWREDAEKRGAKTPEDFQLIKAVQKGELVEGPDGEFYDPNNNTVVVHSGMRRLGPNDERISFDDPEKNLKKVVDDRGKTIWVGED